MKEREDKDIMLIERFFNLDLTDKEMEMFDQRLKKDPIFNSQVKNYKRSIDLIGKKFPDPDQKIRVEKWKQLANEDKKYDNRVSRKQFISIAAAVLLVLISSWYFFSENNNNDLDILAIHAWNKNVGFSDYLLRNGTDNTSKTAVIDAFKLYKKKDYPSTIESLKKYNTSYLHYEDVLLLRALSLHKTGDSKKALKTLDSLLDYPTKKLYDEALWYKGLIHLDLGELASAKKYLIIPKKKTDEIQLK